MAMNLSDALKLLGIHSDYYNNKPSYSELKRMRRDDLIKHHPDRGGDTDKFTEVSMAWDRVMQHEADKEIARLNQCQDCEGTGWVEIKSAFGIQKAKCKKCEGTGRNDRTSSRRRSRAL